MKISREELAELLVEAIYHLGPCLITSEDYKPDYDFVKNTKKFLKNPLIKRISKSHAYSAEAWEDLVVDIAKE